MLQALLAIILIDLSLSADNALIIGIVARDLPQEHRRRAIVVGGALAVVFRVVLTALAAVLLTIPISAARRRPRIPRDRVPARAFGCA